jgi:hypothetical protein
MGHSIVSLTLEFTSIAEARECILEKEVESVIRKSHAEQFQWMENKFAVPLRKDLDSWPKFIELTERRNLFVHTGGIVSSQYLKVCQEHGVVFSTTPTIGNELGLAPAYFKEAVDIVFEIGVKLAHVLWRKLKPDEIKEADKNLNSIAYEPLLEENYKLAKVLFDFAAVTLKKYANDEARRVFVVNRALAYKWGGEDDKGRKIIEAEDWSATGGKFSLAEAVILENYPAALKIMRGIGKNQEEVPNVAYREWPLFKEFRKTIEFQQTFQEIVGEPLTKLEEKETCIEETDLPNISEPQHSSE